MIRPFRRETRIGIIDGFEVGPEDAPQLLMLHASGTGAASLLDSLGHRPPSPGLPSGQVQDARFPALCRKQRKRASAGELDVVGVRTYGKNVQLHHCSPGTMT